jgi:CheY-like chemotaxis protein
MKSILLIEDDPFIIDIYSKKLKEAGFSVEVANDGQEALKKLQEYKPDLLVLDIVLPNIDGWEFLREIRNEPSLKDLDVIILSNLSQKAEIEKSKELGAIRYLVKAYYTPTQVVEEIKTILEK